MSDCVFVLVNESPTELRDRAEIDSVGVQYRSHENEERTESDQELDDSRISVPTSRQSQHKVVLLSPTLYVCGNRYWSARSKFLSNQREPSVFFLYRVSKKRLRTIPKYYPKWRLWTFLRVRVNQCLLETETTSQQRLTKCPATLGGKNEGCSVYM